MGDVRMTATVTFIISLGSVAVEAQGVYTSRKSMCESSKMKREVSKPSLFVGAYTMLLVFSKAIIAFFLFEIYFDAKFLKDIPNWMLYNLVTVFLFIFLLPIIEANRYMLACQEPIVLHSFGDLQSVRYATFWAAWS